MNRTLIAPTPEHRDGDAAEGRDERARAGDEPQAVERPTPPMPRLACALAAAGAIGSPPPRRDAEHQRDRHEERGRVHDEDGPHDAADARDQRR